MCDFVGLYVYDLFVEIWEFVVCFCKLIIVVVFGYVFGGGCEIVMMCDFIIVFEIVKFG